MTGPESVALLGRSTSGVTRAEPFGASPALPSAPRSIFDGIGRYETALSWGNARPDEPSGPVSADGGSVSADGGSVSADGATGARRGGRRGVG
jgi:hypothetical protein